MKRLILVWAVVAMVSLPALAEPGRTGGNGVGNGPGGGFNPTGGGRGDRRTRRPGGHFKEVEIAPWISKLCAEMSEYRTKCKDVPEFAGFSRSLQDFDSTLSNLKNQLSTGFDQCKPQLKRVVREFADLEQAFQSTLSTHKLYKVRLGWLKVRTAYLELDYAATGGQPIP